MASSVHNWRPWLWLTGMCVAWCAGTWSIPSIPMQDGERTFCACSAWVLFAVWIGCLGGHYRNWRVTIIGACAIWTTVGLTDQLHLFSNAPPILLPDWNAIKSYAFLVLLTVGVAAAVHQLVDVRRRSANSRTRMRCVSCGYLLFGLTEPRCPECGRGFSPELLNAAIPDNDNPAHLSNSGNTPPR